MITQIRQRLEQEKGRLRQVQLGIDDAKSRLADLLERGLDIEQAQVIIQTVAQQTQGQLEWYINDMVTAAIEAVFPDDNFKFFLKFEQRRGATEADLFLGDEHGNRIRPRDADGGGLVNVVAFALRVSLWSLTRSTRPVLVLDEPFHFLHSRDAHGKVAVLVLLVTEKLGLQIIMVTGEDESEEMISTADKVFRILRGAVK